MAKIFDSDRHKYEIKISPYKTTIDGLLKREHAELAMIKQYPLSSVFKHLSLTEDMLVLASNYLVQNGISQSILKAKNEDALNEARKSLYKAVIYLEGIVSNLIDASFMEYEKQLARIENITCADRYLLVRKMGLAIQLLENAYGYNTKWKWAFVELEGRHAALVKNILDLRNVVTNIDPRSPNYEPTIYHLRLVKKLLLRSANRYREKYELSTNRIDDFKTGIAFLSALKRFNAVIGDRSDAITAKKKLDIWTAKLEADIKKQEELLSRKI
jgi:hypothetical protein